jgi:DNA-binding GntR family transcriptional regulator
MSSSFPISQRADVNRGTAELPAPRLAVDPLSSPASFKRQAYTALKNAIASMDVYRSRAEIRLDERRLAHEFGISRTPVREAMAQLEREGFVRSVPRRGVYVVRKTKREVIELITAWAALESMAARLITEAASGEDIAALRRMFATFENGALHPRPHAHHRSAGSARHIARRGAGARSRARPGRARGEIRRLSGLKE